MEGLWEAEADEVQPSHQDGQAMQDPTSLPPPFIAPNNTNG